MKGNLNEVFGVIIKELRESRSLSQQELADYAELDRSYISDLERGRYNPTINTVYKLAEILKVTPHEIFRRVDKKVL